jgi:hypothetical protein
LVGLRVRRHNEPVGDRAKHQVLLFLAVRPSLSGGAIPIFGLSGVVGVERRGGHVSFLKISGRRGERLAFLDDVSRNYDGPCWSVHAAVRHAGRRLKSITGGARLRSRFISDRARVNWREVFRHAQSERGDPRRSQRRRSTIAQLS